MITNEKARIELVPLRDINFETTGKLRKVHPDSEAYLDIKRSILKHGYNSVKPILLCHMRDEQGNLTKQLDCRDGHQRGDICKNAFGLDFKIPAVIDDDMTEEEALMWQYRLNTNVPTTLKEKATYFKQFAAAHPFMTQEEIAELHSVAPAYISKVLRFDKLIPEAAKLVDEGKIKSTAALLLCTIPTEFQKDFIKESMEMPTQKFVEHVQGQRQAIREALKTGREKIEKQIVPHLLSSDEVKLKYSREKQILEGMDEDHEDYSLQTGRVAVLEEVLQIDPATIARKEAERAQTKEQAALERAQKRRDEAEKHFQEVMAKTKAKQEAEASNEAVEAKALI